MNDSPPQVGDLASLPRAPGTPDGPAVLIGVDGSPSARRALRWADRAARKLGGRVVIAHGIARRDGRPTSTESVHEARAVAEVIEAEWCGVLRANHTPYSIEVGVGRTPDVMAQLARRDAPVLRVMGSV
jgi:nucleotide-binding universal stress UspA family protein